MAEITHDFVERDGVRLHVAEAGSGPLVLLLHGFPECWYSWRHQLTALGDAGFHAVAFDQRGYGRSDRPEPVDAYTMLHLVGDVVAVLDAHGEERAVVVGHDWGAPVAWHTAQLLPERVRGVVGLSVPHLPRGRRPPLSVLRELFGDGFYIAYFQEPGVADAELARDPEATFRRLLTAASGETPPLIPLVPDGGGLLDLCPEPERLPGWLTKADLDVYTAEFAAGFTGGLNWYRNLDRNWELTAPWQHAPVRPPALFITGDRDLTTAAPGSVEDMRSSVPNLRDPIRLPGIGHWTQQEAPAEVTAAITDFLGSLD